MTTLPYYGIRGASLRLLESYLTNRSQYVHLNSINSSFRNISCGVPQGSVLGPLLFLLFINDMPLISSLVSYILYADDTTGIFSSPSLDDLFQIAVNELNSLNDWFSSNKLLINSSKTNFVLFMTRQRELSIHITESLDYRLLSRQINRKDETKFLGLLLDKNLDFKPHINYSRIKISKGLYMLSRAAKILNSRELKLIYSAIILPYLTYGILVWGGKCKIYRAPYLSLDRGQPADNMCSLSYNLQKRALRIISKSHPRSHHIPICSSLQLLDLEDIYNVRALSFFYDFFHDKLPPYFNQFVSLRYSRNDELFIKTRFHRTNIASSSLCHTLPYIWNPLPIEIKNNLLKSKFTFIRSLKNYYLDKYSNWECHTHQCYSCSKS